MCMQERYCDESEKHVYYFDLAFLYFYISEWESSVFSLFPLFREAKQSLGS